MVMGQAAYNGRGTASYDPPIPIYDLGKLRLVEPSTVMKGVTLTHVDPLFPLGRATVHPIFSLCQVEVWGGPQCSERLCGQAL